VRRTRDQRLSARPGADVPGVERTVHLHAPPGRWNRCEVQRQCEGQRRRGGGCDVRPDAKAFVRAAAQDAVDLAEGIEAARARSEKSMSQRLAAELLEASENRGAAVRKREDTHRMADANKAFAHYRW